MHIPILIQLRLKRRPIELHVKHQDQKTNFPSVKGRSKELLMNYFLESPFLVGKYKECVQHAMDITTKFQVSTLETTHLTLTPSVFHRKPRYTSLNYSSMVPPHYTQKNSKKATIQVVSYLNIIFMGKTPAAATCMASPHCIHAVSGITTSCYCLKHLTQPNKYLHHWSCGSFRFQLPMMPTQLNQQQKHLHCSRYCSVWAEPISYVVLWPPSTYTLKRIHLYENTPVPY